MLTVGGFFAGVGGIELGFENTGFFRTVYANEFDPYPAKTHELNSGIPVDVRDIAVVRPDSIPDFNVCVAGFPCQSFSVAGERLGFGDSAGRGLLFFELARILEAKRPRIVFLENVKNLVTHDKGNTIRVILDTIEHLGYHIKYEVLNTYKHGNIPQNRERIYIVGFLDEEHCDRFSFPNEIPLTTRVSDVIDFKSKVDDIYYYTPGRFKGDIYEKLDEALDDSESVYQWRRHYARKNQSGVIPALTANQGMGGHNVCIVRTRHGIRKMTPRECFNAQGFPRDFVLPEGMSNSRLYKQAGNSVSVPVIERIAENIYTAMTD